MKSIRTDDLLVLLSARPTEEELSVLCEDVETVLAGLRRRGGRWEVHPTISHLTRQRSPASVYRSAKRAREAVEVARRVLHAA